MKRSRLSLLICGAILVWAAFMLITPNDPSEVSPQLEALRSLMGELKDFATSGTDTFVLASLFGLAIGIAAIIGLPPPGLITVAASATLGFGPAFGASVPAAAIGALVPFLAARTFLGPWIERRWNKKLAIVKSGFAEDGAWYLFSLRLIPLVPFPLVNLFMGLTTISLKMFFLVSLVGRLPLTALYCNAGMQLASIGETTEIFTDEVVISLAALALFPHVVKALLNVIKTYRKTVSAASRSL